jgi:hypothetical protein
MRLNRNTIISACLFFAGLFYLLEFFIPPTIPWKTREGRVVAVGEHSITVQIDGSAREVEIPGNAVVLRQVPDSGERVVAKTEDVIVGETVRLGPTTYLAQWRAEVDDFFLVIVNFTLGFGLISLSLVHIAQVKKRSSGYYNSILLFIAMATAVVATFWDNAPDGTLRRQIFDTMYFHITRALGSTTFSLLTFYMASAAYRAFKVKSLEAGIMAISAVIVMMGQVPLGMWLTQSLPRDAQVPTLAGWILYIPNTAAYRAVMFGIMMGALATALRIWLSLERGGVFAEEV